MASAVFSKPYRFILVSDLDWTMVSAIRIEHINAMQGWAAWENASRWAAQSAPSVAADWHADVYSAWHLAPISICLMLQVDHEDKQNAALNAFNELWKSKFAEDSLLVFSTGRSLALYNELRVCSKFSSAHLISSMLCHVRLQREPCTAAAWAAIWQ